MIRSGAIDWDDWDFWVGSAGPAVLRYSHSDRRAGGSDLIFASFVP